ncbi:hypothetical protein [Sphingobacterium detergens]|uniref:Uncharacterized protein n=1 Tax=Sphingobacterium detergens TaxID=1145106 RepID=A0A420BFP1_SPHD1|nr:hypothetical protein [Sphingobacterium detergens]RKE55520.1 hypothetical protein DFQ12_0352 [Sphingobacterium detergens]
MKRSFILTLAVGTFLQSCRYKAQDHVKEKVTPAIERDVIQVDTIKTAAIPIRSFIGKTTNDIDLSKMHECFGVMLSRKASKDKYALAQYSAVIDHCQHGQSKFVIERFLRHDANGKSVFLIVDELDVVANYPAICFGNFQLAIENDIEGDYFVEFYNNDAEIITQVRRIWRIDLEKEKFVEITKPKNLRLINPDYVESDEDPAFTFPSTGEKVLDFIVDPTVFEIQYETVGDLNADGLSDIVMVRRDKTNKMAIRSILVLLQNKDKSYRLDKISNLLMPVEFNKDGSKIYGTEDISVVNGELHLNFYGLAGVQGNIWGHYKYFGDDLVLTYVETYNVGAGSSQSLYYDVVEGKLTEEITDTAKEEMPVKTNTFKMKKEKYLFENGSLNGAMETAYKIVNNN